MRRGSLTFLPGSSTRHLVTSLALVSCLGLTVPAAAAGGHALDRTSGAPAALSPRPDDASRDATGLTAGFATVDMTWRAGAKPGQVGTEADTAAMIELWRGLGKVLLHGYHYQTLDRPVVFLEYATAWTLDHLEARVADIRYDVYNTVFEPGRGLHTRATAKAMVLADGEDKVAVVRADLYLMQKHIWRRVTELVAEETGIPPEHILIAATHNHSAADAAFTAAGLASLADDFDPRHFVWITHRIAEAIIAADRVRVPASMGAIRSTLRAVQRNVIGPATGQAIPPGGTEPVDVPAGYPVDFFDDALWILYFNDLSSGERIGAYVVFGMHPESLEDGHGLLSSDFFGPMEAGLEKRWGCPVMWSPGALGDVEPDNGTNTGTDYWREDFAVLDQQVQVLVDAIGPVLETPSATDQVLPSRNDIDVDARLRLFAGPPNTNYPGPNPWMLPVTEYLSPEWPITCVRAMTETANLVLQAVRLGDVLLLGSPSEVTTDMALHIRSRVDDVEGDLYQGYVWPDAEPWVADYVDQNFDDSELTAGEGFAMPIVLSQVNDWMGYMVTRWEFDNRNHYRQSLTLYGDETANYLAASFEGLARELRGEPAVYSAWDDPSWADLDLEDDVYAFVADLDGWVSDWARDIPPSDPFLVGRVLQDPWLEDDGEMHVPAVHFQWGGGTSDLGFPRVIVQQDVGFGVWEDVIDETDPHLWLLYRSGGYWEAVWHLVDPSWQGNFRFLVTGVSRGTVAGVSDPDPLWDPEGMNRTYQVVSLSISVP